MKKIINKEATQTPQLTYEQLQKGYGTKHPEKISGFMAFSFRLGNVFASDKVAARMEINPAFQEFVFSSLQSFQNDNYGYISQLDEEGNVEAKWLSGGGDLFGRYAYGKMNTQKGVAMPEEYIKIRMYKNDTYILFDSEPDWLILSE